MQDLTIPDLLLVGRGEALRTALKVVHNETNASPVIVEIGVLRDPSGWREPPENPVIPNHLQGAARSDGWSSLLWAWYATEHPKAKIQLVDIQQGCIDVCSTILHEQLAVFELPENITLVCNDAVAFFLELPPCKIDLLYLDGGDEPTQMMDHFTSASTLNFLQPGSRLLLDDIPADPNRGKGTILVPHLRESKDWILELDDTDHCQMLWKRVDIDA